jgi:2-amino-4-hydroxy-6-hydroxymethyldihydropteridine diphosphokinase
MEDPRGDAGHRRSSLAVVEEVPVEARSVEAYIGLGANVGDARATLESAVASLAASPDVRLRDVSRLYATAPVGVTDQPDFLNAVAALDVPGGPDAATGALRLLAQLKEIERAAGRQARRRWGPRELDLDLLVFGDARLAVERPLEGRSIEADTDPGRAARLLEVPHREAAERLFVLVPLTDVAPRLVPPGWDMDVRTRRDLVASREPDDAVRAVGDWDAEAMRWRSMPA